MTARDDLLAIPDELLRSGAVAEASLVSMDFATGAKRWWTGFGDLDLGGQRWQGVGDLIEIGEIAQAYQVSAEPLTFRLAVTAEMMALVRGAREAWAGREVVVSSQLFAMATGQPMGSPIALFSGTMWQLTYSADGPDSRAITLHCEGLFARRNAPPRGLWTDRDQQARHPGDKGFELIARYVTGEVRWP